MHLYGALDQQVFDLADGARWVESFRTHVHTVHDGITAKQAIRVLEIVEPLVYRFVAGIRDEAICLQETCGSDKFIGIPPERRARRRTARAQYAFVEAI